MHYEKLSIKVESSVKKLSFKHLNDCDCPIYLKYEIHNFDKLFVIGSKSGENAPGLKSRIVKLMEILKLFELPFFTKLNIIWYKSTHLNFLRFGLAVPVLRHSQTQWKPRWSWSDLIVFASMNNFGKVSREHHLEVTFVRASQEQSMNSFRAKFSPRFHSFFAFLSLLLILYDNFHNFHHKMAERKFNWISFSNHNSMPQFTFVGFVNYFNLKSDTIKFENTINRMEEWKWKLQQMITRKWRLKFQHSAQTEDEHNFIDVIKELSDFNSQTLMNEQEIKSFNDCVNKIFRIILQKRLFELLLTRQLFKPLNYFW